VGGRLLKVDAGFEVEIEGEALALGVGVDMRGMVKLFTSPASPPGA